MLTITIAEAWDYPSKLRVLVICPTCNEPIEIKVNSLRVTLKANGGTYKCGQCVKNSDEYLKKQQAAHPKTGSKWNSLVVVKCRRCGSDNEITYRSRQALVRKQEEYRCLHCSKVELHEQGCFDHLYTNDFKANLKQASERFWEKARPIWKSVYMAAALADPRYKLLMSECGRRAWANLEFRERMIARRNDPAYRILLSEYGKIPWIDPEYRRKMIAISIATNSRPEIKAKQIAYSRNKWLDPEYRATIIAATKARWRDPAYQIKMAIIRANQSNKPSKPQLMLYRYLDDLGVIYYKEGPDTRVGKYVLDCVIPSINGSKNIIIECQGDHWHGSWNIVKKRSDQGKFTYISRFYSDYELMYIWEHEFYAKDRVLDRLKLKLGLQIETKNFDFKDVVLKQPTTKEVNSFLDSYHYIGKGRGGEVIGAYLNNEFIACVVYSAPLRQNTAGQFGLKDNEVRELSRLCIHPSYHKRNFASWLIARTIKRFNCLIIAYSDMTVAHNGAIYKAAGFELHHEVDPDYWYVDSDNCAMKKRTLYGRASKMSMTENEFAETYGYAKQWGGKKYCYIMHPR